MGQTTTLTAAVTVTDDTIDVASATDWPLQQFRIAVNGESMLVYDGFDTTTWSVLRDVADAGDSLLFLDNFDDRESPMGTDLGPRWHDDGSTAEADVGIVGGVAVLDILTGGGGIGVEMVLTDQPLDNELRFRFQIVDDLFSEVAGYVRRTGVGPDNYRARLIVDAAGALTLRLQKEIGGVKTNLAAGITPAGSPMILGEWWVMAVRATGASPTNLTAKVWREASGEPSWQTSVADSTAQVQGPGDTAVRFSQQGASTGAFWFDDYAVSHAAAGRVHSIGDTVALIDEWDLPIVTKPGVGAPTSQPDTGAFYVDTSVEPPVFYVRVGSGWRSVTLT